jgi:hypothetical protein
MLNTNPAYRTVGALFASMLASCASFSTVRSAVVSPGPALHAQASVSTPPGDEAAWFFTYECPSSCNRALPGVDAGLTFGRVPDRGTPFALTIGSSGFFPYVEGYWQTVRAPRRAAGFGARIGIPASGWSSHQVFMRFNGPVTDGGTFLWNPSVLYHTGASPNGEQTGSFLGIVNGIGWEMGGPGGALTPSFSVVVGRAEHGDSFRRHGPTMRVFATGGLGIAFR